MRPLLRIPPLGLCLLLLLGACSHTRTVEVEVYDPLPARTFRTFLVLGIHEDARIRRIFENTFAAELAAQGVKGIPSHQLIYQESAIRLPRVHQAIQDSKADAVIATRVLNATLRDGQRKPGRQPQGADAADPFALGAQAPPQLPNLIPQRPSQVVLQTNVYEAAGTVLLLTATSRAVKPESVEELGREVAQETIRSLVREKLLPR